MFINHERQISKRYLIGVIKKINDANSQLTGSGVLGLKPAAYPSVLSNQLSYLSFDPPPLPKEVAELLLLFCSIGGRSQSSRSTNCRIRRETWSVIYNFQTIFYNFKTSAFIIFFVVQNNKIFLHTRNFFDNSLPIDNYIVVGDDSHFISGQTVNSKLLSCMNF